VVLNKRTSGSGGRAIGGIGYGPVLRVGWRFAASFFGVDPSDTFGVSPHGGKPNLVRRGAASPSRASRTGPRH